jgi:hypothetical protein
MASHETPITLRGLNRWTSQARLPPSKEDAMNRVVLGIFVASMLIAGFTFSTQSLAEPANTIVGTWTLVSITNEKNGQKVLPYGPNAKGSFILDGERFSLMVVRPDRVKFKSNNRLTGTPDENQETLRGTIAYFGTYTVDAKDSTLVTFHIEGSTFPNWEGAEQKRVLKVTGDEMNYTNPTISTGAGVARLIWRRVK